MSPIVIYSPFTTPRLSYVLEWLFRERLQLSYQLVHELPAADGGANVICYGTVVQGLVSVPDTGLLSASGIPDAAPPPAMWQDMPVFFAEESGAYSVPFDLFSAIFYLLSRAEEYLPYTPDKHGRYPARASMLYKAGVLQRPLADEWVHAFRQLLEMEWDVKLPGPVYHFSPTYDIDMAYSHLHKGLRRVAGAYLRAMLRVDVKQLNERIQVVRKKQKDPYDSFRWLHHLHQEYDCSPLYFILSALRTTAFDKNIHPQHPAMARVIRNLANDGKIGIHPSYYAHEADTMQREKQTLEQVAGVTTAISRQHYIKVAVPHTYRMLLQHGITEDYSMGYGSHLGFRAGTGSSFLWYDLEQETVTPLRVFPFCFMDTTAHFEQKMTVTEAFDALDGMCRTLQETGSMLITVFHNFSLGTDEQWRGWRQAYEHFIQRQAHK